MSEPAFKELLADLVAESNGLMEDYGPGDRTDFDLGFRTGMRSMLKLIDDKISAHGISSRDLGRTMTDVDRWFAGIPPELQ